MFVALLCLLCVIVSWVELLLDGLGFLWVCCEFAARLPGFDLLFTFGFGVLSLSVVLLSFVSGYNVILLGAFRPFIITLGYTMVWDLVWCGC